MGLASCRIAIIYENRFKYLSPHYYPYNGLPVLREQEVAGSNPAAPTRHQTNGGMKPPLFFAFFQSAKAVLEFSSNFPTGSSLVLPILSQKVISCLAQKNAHFFT